MFYPTLELAFAIIMTLKKQDVADPQHLLHISRVYVRVGARLCHSSTAFLRLWCDETAAVSVLFLRDAVTAVDWTAE